MRFHDCIVLYVNPNTQIRCQYDDWSYSTSEHHLVRAEAQAATTSVVPQLPKIVFPSSLLRQQSQLHWSIAAPATTAPTVSAYECRYFREPEEIPVVSVDGNLPPPPFSNTYKVAVLPQSGLMKRLSTSIHTEKQLERKDMASAISVSFSSQHTRPNLQKIHSVTTRANCSLSISLSWSRRKC